MNRGTLGRSCLGFTPPRKKMEPCLHLNNEKTRAFIIKISDTQEASVAFTFS